PSAPPNIPVILLIFFYIIGVYLSFPPIIPPIDIRIKKNIRERLIRLEAHSPHPVLKSQICIAGG
ncbi:MAG: hypothetical protein WBA91_07070, partial [Paracoccaceae bacterium]